MHLNRPFRSRRVESCRSWTGEGQPCRGALPQSCRVFALFFPGRGIKNNLGIRKFELCPCIWKLLDPTPCPASYPRSATRLMSSLIRFQLFCIVKFFRQVEILTSALIIERGGKNSVKLSEWATFPKLFRSAVVSDRCLLNIYILERCVLWFRGGEGRSDVMIVLMRVFFPVLLAALIMK